MRYECAGVMPHVRLHPLNHSPGRGALWTLLHLPLNISIVLVGSVLEPLKLHSSFTSHAVVTVSVCLAVILVVLLLFDVLYHGGGVSVRRVAKKHRILLQFMFIFLLLLLLAFYETWEHDPVSYLALINTIMAAQVGTTFYSHFPRDHAAEMSVTNESSEAVIERVTHNCNIGMLAIACKDNGANKSSEAVTNAMVAKYDVSNQRRRGRSF